MPDIFNEGSDVIVDFSVDEKAANKLKQLNKTNPSEYSEGLDLASGFPKASIWTTRDGRRIAAANMADGHLINTVRFLHRRVVKYKMQMRTAMLVGVATKSLDFFKDMPESIQEDRSIAVSEHIAEFSRTIMQMNNDLFLRQYCPPYRYMMHEIAQRKLMMPDDLKIEVATIESMGWKLVDCGHDVTEPDWKWIKVDSKGKTIAREWDETWMQDHALLNPT